MTTVKEQLFQQYDNLEDAVEASAVEEMWQLAEWLAEHVPNEGAGRPKKGSQVPISTADLAERGRRSKRQLNELRATAIAFGDQRVWGVAVKTHGEALRQAKGNVTQALKELRPGTKLRDVSPPMESVAALKRQIKQRTPEERAEIREAIGEQDDEEFFADENKAKAHRDHRQSTMEEDARKATRTILWKARARAEFYGDVPLTENEDTELGYAEEIIRSLRRGEQMNNELAQLLDEEGIHAEE